MLDANSEFDIQGAEAVEAEVSGPHSAAVGASSHVCGADCSKPHSAAVGLSEGVSEAEPDSPEGAAEHGCEAACEGAEGADDPRIVTRGSFLSKPLISKENQIQLSPEDSDRIRLEKLINRFFFDWYQVTLPNAEGRAACERGSPEEQKAVQDAIEWAQSQKLHPLSMRGGHNGYLVGLPFSPDPDTMDVVFVINSGSTSGLMPNLMLTGGHGTCSVLAPKLQAAFEGLRLSRADAALDWSQKGLWDELHEMAKLLSASNDKLGGVRTITSDTGRTFYLGSRTSTVSLRVYEKDGERAAKGIIDKEDIDPDLVRIEWTFRPQSKSKAGMAGLNPGQMIRTSVWAREFMVRAAKIMNVTGEVRKLDKQEVEREERQTTLEGTVDHGIHQYGKSFARLAAVKLVERDHDKRFDLAVLTISEVETEAQQIFLNKLQCKGAAEAVIKEMKLDRRMEPEQLAAACANDAINEPSRIERKVNEAKALVGICAERSGMEGVT